MGSFGRCLHLGLFLISTFALTLSPGCGDDDDDEGESDPNVVVTKAGSVRGSSTTKMRSFLGIPYAAPPVGEARWKPPTAAAKFSAERDATQFAAHCPQPATAFGSGDDTSEDCLHLNVYTPTSAAPHPVMVWIHGGAFYLGESDDFDPSALVAQDVVVVTINYRLGPLGFLAHPALTEEGGGVSGNYGLMDQQLALHWVQDNIAAFGGDKDNVTIFGQSAGGVSVHSQLVMTGAAGLFDKAIAQSGAYAVGPGRQPTLTMSETTGTMVLTAAGCADPCSLDDMRALSADKLVTVQLGIPALSSGWIPAVDGKLLKTDVASAYASGTYEKVPVIEGSNHDEYRLFVALNEMNPPNAPAGPLTADGYVTAMKALFGDDNGALLAALYAPAAYDNNPGLAQAAAATDAIFACPMLRTSQLLAADGSVYSFEFNDPKAPQFYLPDVPDFEYAASHGSELSYLFKVKNVTMTDDQKTLSDTMVHYWTNFAKHGDPNGTGLPTWPLNTPAADGILSLAPGDGAIAVTTGFSADHKCDIISPPTP
jgi:para-nitrobenzyl esterase